MIVGKKLHNCFKKTFGKAGRSKIQNRPTMMEWASALAEEMDSSIKCSHCEMEYDPNENKTCPWCDEVNNYVEIVSIQKRDSDEAIAWNYKRECSGLIKAPLRVIEGFKVDDVDKIAFSIAIKDEDIVLSDFSDKYVFEVEKGGNFEKMYGKCSVGRAALIKALEKIGQEEYLISISLKG